jgi:radical SAM protein with 4Fe4S-binding SPASM domain
MGTHSRVGSHRVRGDSRFFVEHGYLEVPSLVQWMATLKCGLSCRHCLAASHAGGFDDMPLEKAKGLIDEVATMGVREFLITGGEPLAREDLGEVIGYLGHRGVSWTLNTAALPEAPLREVIARYPPGFVAVSLDGPREVHDEFRGRAGAWEAALESIRFFKSLAGVRVCAGTTVTRRNYDYLDETFHLVAAGGADQWGIHLLVPEGRAAARRDLFLTRPQLKRLIKFVARKRRYFRVEMADEIGYLGYLEPLVRDVPLTCGAGRSQCVILPDGEVVPCTTLDRSCSAGNIHERPLSQIWAEGFQALRAWRPAGKCERCEYASACKGGCWLQRKAGTQCFKDVWHVPGALKTAAGIAICLGGLASSSPAKATDASPLQEPILGGFPAGQVTPAEGATALELDAAAQATSLNEAIMDFYVAQVMSIDPLTLQGIDVNEPGWRFFLDLRGGSLPQDITERCVAVRAALETQQRSLSLAALLWRGVSEPLFDPNTVREYSETERQIIRDTLAAIELKAQEWRLEIFENNLDPYLADDRITQGTWYPNRSKAPGPGRYVYDERYYLSKDVNEERWGARTNPESHEAAVAYLEAHHYADQMELTLMSLSNSNMLRRYRAGESEIVNVRSNEGTDPCSFTVGLFDVIEPVTDVTLGLAMEGSIRAAPLYDPNYANLLDDQDVEQDLSTAISVTLKAGQQYTYVELLNTIYQGHKATLLMMAYDWVRGDPFTAWDELMFVSVATCKNGPVLWPAFRDIVAMHCASGSSYPIEKYGYPCPELHRRAVLKDIDFWMF